MDSDVCVRFKAPVICRPMQCSVCFAQYKKVLDSTVQTFITIGIYLERQCQCKLYYNIILQKQLQACIMFVPYDGMHLFESGPGRRLRNRPSCCSTISHIFPYFFR